MLDTLFILHLPSTLLLNHSEHLPLQPTLILRHVNNLVTLCTMIISNLVLSLVIFVYGGQSSGVVGSERPDLGAFYRSKAAQIYIIYTLDGYSL